ncbi:MAG: dephospho-CoA kinase [Phaeovulum sp.]|uniref:dephospho-CoA kinase n=1 Tax=Phaeovulum sp. TaxID=2934796 RepID=UPI0027376D4E|nr:dephospho-CoA kinase [Phaeovulum sp.]MDP3861574.1 dephospho-CoA kinase [Phaeovulum sp.]
MSRSFILGLTGSIGMGKSTTAAMFAEAGVPVWDADAAVHALYARGGTAVAPIAAAFPAAVRDGVVDRGTLKTLLTTENQALSRLESLVHPLVAADRAAFIRAHASAPLIVLDIPLLFETGADALCDATLVVTAAPEVQRARVLSRPGITERQLDLFLARQLPDAEKRARATHVIETRSLEQTRAAVQDLIAKLRGA